ncbi:proton-coupled amino acid transporter-like protein pathetic isoform X1 [Vespula maculifrons]|uniref:Proton-coupled amino acid transporter-like protein pathetic isoform X1 n=1 Tax=Vespula maculifrons TaxID=7453 RepID=A0ABD2BTY1_VESMC
MANYLLFLFIVHETEVSARLQSFVLETIMLMLKTKENVEGIDESLSENVQTYDSFSTQQDELKISDFSAFIHIMKVSVTAGILFMPNTFRKTGYVMSVICGLLTGVIYMHNSVVLVQCSQILCRHHRLPNLDLAQTVEVSFLTGPENTRWCARGFAIFTNIIICFIQYSEVVIYILYVASSFQQVIEYYGNIVMNIRIYVLIFFPIYCCLILVPNFKYLVPFSIFGTIFFIIGITISLIYFLEDFPSLKRLDAFTNVRSVPMFLTIFIYALHNITILLPLENIMHNPTNLPRLIIISTLFNTIIYIIFGFLGYNKYKDTCDTVIKNLPLDEVLAEIVKIGISMSILFSIGINYIIPVQIIWPIIMHFTGVNYRYEILFRLVGIALLDFWCHRKFEYNYSEYREYN